ncbi:MAG: hypothetical protein ACREGG_00770 [Candidatus Saccharimonadales bacterium]
MPEKKKLYVGCSLTHAPEDFKQQVADLKLALTRQWDVLEFVGLVAGTPAEVHQTDIGHIHNCDAFLGICDYPSLGLGGELDRAWVLEKPGLGVAHVSTKVSRFVLGAADIYPNFSFDYYHNMVIDVPEIAAEVFEPVLYN